MLGRIILGLVAAALAVLLVHQPIIWGLASAKILPPTSLTYNMEPLKSAPAALASAFLGFGFKGWPTLFNQLFWGGMWGALFGLVLAPLPLASWLKGLMLGVLVVVAGNWLLVPLLKGGALFGGLDPSRMAITSLINLPFGIATGMLYGLIARSGRA
jgi:hypothetical protein